MTFFQSINLFYYATFVAEKPVANSGKFSWLWCGADLLCDSNHSAGLCRVPKCFSFLTVAEKGKREVSVWDTPSPSSGYRRAGGKVLGLTSKLGKFSPGPAPFQYISLSS